MQRILFLLLALVIISSCKNELPIPKPAQIIPQPQELVTHSGYFELNEHSVLYFDQSNSKMTENADFFLSLVKKSTGFELTTSDLKLDKEKESRLIFVLSDTCSNIGLEGYYLLSTPEAVTIIASTERGVFYGIQSLRQLFTVEFESDEVVESSWVIPALWIRDEPKFAWRGMLLDCCRHFMEPAFVKRYIDLLAYHKMNRLHWHLTEDQGWRIEILKYPELTEVGAYRIEEDGTLYGGYYSQAEIREIVEYARIRQIEVVPEIELPGHSVSAIATYPHLSCTGDSIAVANRWGVFKDIYCAGKETTFEFLEGVLEEVVGLFPFGYIHIGGDEAPKFRWENCAQCQQRINDERLHDEAHLQTYFITRIEKFLSTKNRRIIGWDEILEGGLAPEVTVQSWRGFDGAIEAARHHHDAIMSPTSHCYFDYSLESIDLQKVYQFNPIPDGLEPEFHKYILGGECNMWTERAPQEEVDDRMFPRMLAMAEVLWTAPDPAGYPEFHQRVQTHYGRLDQLGVKYGFESKAISFVAKANDSNNGLLIELMPGQPGFEVHYSVDGTVPGLASPKYSKPISINEDTWLRAVTLKEEGGPSYRIEPHLYIHQGLMKTIRYHHPYSPNYPGGGEHGLLDGVGGSDNFRDNRWQGFFGTDLQVSIDFGKEVNLTRLNTSFLQSSLSWIYMPSQVRVEALNTNGEYELIGQLELSEDPRLTKTFVKSYQVDLKEGLYREVRLTATNFGKNPEWHDAAGADTWVFCDEIAFY
jgi:hexosaminidase